MIEKRQARIRQPQQRDAQEAGDLDRPMRILNPRQRRRFPRHHPSREMFQTSKREIRQNQPVGAQLLEEIDFPDLPALERDLNPVRRRTRSGCAAERRTARQLADHFQ